MLKIDRWRESYHHDRPRSQLEYQTPVEFAEVHRKREEKQSNSSQNFAWSLVQFLEKDKDV